MFAVLKVAPQPHTWHLPGHVRTYLAKKHPSQSIELWSVRCLLAVDSLSDMLCLKPVVWIDPDLDYMLLVRREFLNADVQNPVVCLTSGELALSYLTGYRATDEPLPAVLLIGGKLPQMSRLALVTEVRQIPRLASVPVIFLGGGPDMDEQVLKQLSVKALLSRVAPARVSSLVQDILKFAPDLNIREGKF